MSEEVVVVEGLTKYYGEVKALDGASFKVMRGEVYGLIGPNGAGKTTTLRILATLIKPTSGKAFIEGLDVVKSAEEVRKRISYLPEEAGAYKNLSGLEYLEFMGRFYAKTREELEKMVEEAIEISGLQDRIRDKTKTYSKGMVRRLLIARTLMVKPRVAILDEPTGGLDVNHAIYVRNIIREYVKKHRVTVILSSHNMLEVEYLCDRVALIDRGRIMAEGSPRELMEEFNVRNLEEAFIRVTGYVK